jgi:hypothetical protein
MPERPWLARADGDQAACGFSGGSFDVTVTDRSATDIPDFVGADPLLKDVTITKATMQK